MAVVARVRRLTKPSTRLRAIAKGLVPEILDAMNEQTASAARIMRTEPPPKAGSTYVRTHEYINGWYAVPARDTGKELIGYVHNVSVEARRYAVYVGGDETGEGQQLQHAITGWPLLQFAVRGGEYGNKLFDQEVRHILRELFRGG